MFNSLATNTGKTRSIQIGTTNKNKLNNCYVAPTTEYNMYLLPTNDTEIDGSKTYYIHNMDTNEYTIATPDFSSGTMYFEWVTSNEIKYEIVDSTVEGAMLALSWVSTVKGWTVS